MHEHEFHELGTTSRSQGMGWPDIQETINWCSVCGAIRIDCIDWDKDKKRLGCVQLPTGILDGTKAIQRQSA